MSYELNLNDIKPKNIKKSDKYSKQIYEFMKNHAYGNQVFYNEMQYDDESKTYIKKQFNANEVCLGDLFITKQSFVSEIDISGKCIRSIVGTNKDKYTNYCYCFSKKPSFTNVTEEFWIKYIEIGKCIYDDHDWLKNEETRYTYINDRHRKCNWCGKEQELKALKRIHTYNKWIDKE